MSNQHDSEILSHIFNPLLPNGELLYDEDIPENLHETTMVDIMSEPENQLAKELELDGVKSAENGNLSIALDYFIQAIEIAPNRASTYNNRAQVYRLLENIQEAKMDLNKAIDISEGKGRAGCQAFCQRGLIHLKENRVHEAKLDFECAAKLGSSFAKAQLVQMNPYAALCNKMLRGIMTKLQQGDSDYYENNETILKQ